MTRIATCAWEYPGSVDIVLASRPVCFEPEPLRRARAERRTILSTFIIRFPYGTREHRYGGRDVALGDRISHDGKSWTVLSVVFNYGGPQTVTVEFDSDELTDILQSEKDAIDVGPLHPSRRP